MTVPSDGDDTSVHRNISFHSHVSFVFLIFIPKTCISVIFRCVRTFSSQDHILHVLLIEEYNIADLIDLQHAF